MRRSVRHRDGRRRARLGRRALAVGLAGVALLGPTACSTTTAPDSPPDMAGAVVVSWEERPDGLVLSLEAEAGEYDAATVAVVPDTEILQVTPSGTAVATTAEVVEATRLDVWFTGPVAESHPVQATAGTVLLRD